MKMTLPLRSFVLGAVALLVTASTEPVSAQDKPAGKVHVLAFSDTNLDGVLNASERPAASETVQIYRIDDDGKRTLVQTGKTDDKGEYVFDGLPPGRYVVVYTFSSGVTLETLPFGVSGDKPEIFIKPAPLLPKDRMIGFSLFDLGFRNPANTMGDQVSRFSPAP